MILVDTSALIDCLTGPRRSAPRLRALIEDGHRLTLSSLVLYEWLRGPRLLEELEAQAALFPLEEMLVFAAAEAELAAQLYRQLARPRGREIDLAIAAQAVVAGAGLWTLNPTDFLDIPALQLVE